MLDLSTTIAPGANDNMFDVGLFGLWYGHNYGSMLTYFALNRLLQSFGLSVLMIENPLGPDSGTELPDNHPSLFAKNKYNVSRKYLLSRMCDLNTLCCSFMVGADQLWHYGLSWPYKHTYFLEFAADDKTKIAYGTSFGAESYNGPKEERPIVGKLLKRFDHLSVRDDASVHICKSEFDIEAVKVIDPVFLCPPRDFDALSEQARVSLPDNFYFAYILNPNPAFGEALSRIATKSRMPIVVLLDFPQERFADNCARLAIAESEQIRILKDIRSEDFIAIMKNASFVITDSFHGCCFSICFRKNFVCRKNRFRAPMRFGSLLAPLSLEDRLLDDERFIADVCLNGTPIDYLPVHDLLENDKEKATVWLKNALNIRKQVARKQTAQVGIGTLSEARPR